MISPRTAYLRNTFGQEDAGLQKVSASDEAIHVRPEDARILEFLIKTCGIKTIVEIGTLAGYGAIRMARALPPDGHVYTLEADPVRVERARKNIVDAGLADKITVMPGTALKTLTSMSGPYDMVFIDADKISYDAYLDWAEKAIRKGGLIVGDNTFLFGATYEPTLPEGVSKSALAAMLSFNKRLADSSRYCSMMVPSDEGMTVGMKLF